MLATRLAHVCFKVSDMASAKAFYVDGLGFEHLYDLTFGDVLRQVAIDRAAGTLPADIDDGAVAFLEAHAANVWSSYLKIAPGQFLELFVGAPGDVPLGDLEHRIGYQHCALEVDDIEAARADLTARGVAPDGDVHIGPDQTKQLWLVDRDGNRIELQEYTADSLQARHGGLLAATGAA